MKTVISDGQRIPAKLWIPLEDVEPSAIQQIKNVANLPFGFQWLAIMPDVHTGYGATVGTVFASTDCVVPYAVGVDIGCGMMAVKTPFELGKVQAELPKIFQSIQRSIPTGKTSHQMPILESLQWGEGWSKAESFLNLEELAKAKHQMGTLGGGNHFIEICADESGAVWIMLHSGSRNIGKRIADKFRNIAKEQMKVWHIEGIDPDLSYLPVHHPQGWMYLMEAGWAQDYAAKNREAMMNLIRKDLAHALNDGLNWEWTEAVNCHHNYVEQEHHYGKDVWVTRKGAIRARAGERGIIPGSMGAKSFIVEGLGNPESFNSASHGAGRRMGRKQAERTFTVEDFNQQMQGILCTPGVVDEIPAAYKNIDEVMANQMDLVKPIHTLKQVMCIKGDD